MAAILSPVFAKARKKVRQSSCLSNLKQLELAEFQYKQDWDETNPAQSEYAIVVNGAGFYWYDAIQPYVKSYKIYRCPSHTNTGYSPTASDETVSYVMNSYLANKADAAVATPADVFMYWDSPMANRDTRDSADSGAFTNEVPGPSGYDRMRWIASGYPLIHFDGDNYCFSDGHAKWLKYASVPASDARFKVH